MIPIVVRVDSPSVKKYTGKVKFSLFNAAESVPARFRFELVLASISSVDMQVQDADSDLVVFLSHDGRWPQYPRAAAQDVVSARIITTIQAIQLGITKVVCARNDAHRRGLGAIVDEANVRATVSAWADAGDPAAPIYIAHSEVVSPEHLLYPGSFPFLA